MRLIDEATMASDGSDRSLVLGSRRGEAEAFARLYAKYRPPLFQACLRRLRCSNLAEDAVHETFERALNHLDSFDVNKRLYPWLVTIAQNVCIDTIRARSRVELMRERDGDAEVVIDLRQSSEDITASAVIDSEDRRSLGRALATLPARQRRVLLLYALENWSYAEIASAENASVSSVKSLIFRARDHLRRVCDKGLLSIPLLPLARLRLRLRRRVAQAQAAAPTTVSAGVFSLQAVMPSAVGVALALTSLGAVTLVPRSVPETAIATSRVGGDLILGHVTRSEPARSGSADTASDDVSVLQRHLFDDRSKDATPDDTQITSFAVSPSYEHDGTVFAAGVTGCSTANTCALLFVSTNRGRSWRRLPARDLLATSLLLPPNFPRDRRIFATGPQGLQVSTDGGRSFESISAVGGNAAISPGFAGTDRRILLGTPSGVMEYRDDVGAVIPSAYAAATQPLPYVAFSPAYAADRTVFIGTMQPDPSNLPMDSRGSALNVCEDRLCRQINLPSSGSPAVRFSSQYSKDRSLVAFTPGDVLLSQERGSFERLAMRLEDAVVADVAYDGETLVVGFLDHLGMRGSGGVLISRDRGASWSSSTVPGAGFDDGVLVLTALPDGRLLAAGVSWGIACSADGGQTWQRRCRAT